MSFTKSNHSRRKRVGRSARVTTARRKAVLKQFEGSGLSGVAFARKHGIKYSTFTSWVRRARASSPSRSFALAEVVVESPSPSWPQSTGACLHLPGGAWLHLDGQPEHIQQAAQLLKALQA